jgi:hypothetical protein
VSNLWLSAAHVFFETGDYTDGVDCQERAGVVIVSKNILVLLDYEESPTCPGRLAPLASSPVGSYRLPVLGLSEVAATVTDDPAPALERSSVPQCILQGSLSSGIVFAVPEDYLDRGKVLAWAMYDWANSAFAITVMAGFFPVFFKQ